MSSLVSLLLFLYSNYIEQREYCRSILGCHLKPRHHHHQPRTPRVTGASTIASKPKATWGTPPSGRNTLTHHTNHADSASAEWSLVPHIPQLGPLLLHRVPLNRRIASTVLRIPLDSTFGECNCCGADSESIILAVSGRRQEKQTTLRRCHCLRYSACLLQYPTSNYSSLFESPKHIRITNDAILIIILESPGNRRRRRRNKTLATSTWAVLAEVLPKVPLSPLFPPPLCGYSSVPLAYLFHPVRHSTLVQPQRRL